MLWRGLFSPYWLEEDKKLDILCKAFNAPANMILLSEESFVPGGPRVFHRDLSYVQVLLRYIQT
jgi:hypothetical protein